MAFKEEEYLQLSGLQHFSFCRRQWALIHIEQQWAENVRTTDGRILHEKAHDGSIREKRGALIITRDMSIHSSMLGVSGKCDVVEFHRSENGIPLPRQEGLWQPYPVEYKRGAPKITDAAGRKRLRSITKECVNYGQRVQNSVFECILDAAQCKQLQHKLRTIMDEGQDSLRFYYLGNKYQTKVEHFGVNAGYEAEGVLIV